MCVSADPIMVVPTTEALVFGALYFITAFWFSWNAPVHRATTVDLDLTKHIQAYNRYIDTIQKSKAVTEYCQAQSILSQKSDQVVSAVVIARHGDRTPNNRLKDDTNVTWNCHGPSNIVDGITSVVQQTSVLGNNGWQGNCTLGQLTRKGYQQQIELGQILKQAYGHLPFKRAFSSRTSRTMTSASGVLHGLGITPDKRRVYIENGDVELLHVKTLYSICPTLKNSLSKRLDHKLVAYIKDQNADYLQRVAKLLGTTSEAFAENLLARSCNNLPTLLDKGDLVRAHAIKSWAWYYNDNYFPNVIQQGDSSQHRLTLGIALKEINKVLDTPERHGLYLYATHDTTISAFLGALNADANVHYWPPYSSNLVFERLKDNTTRIIYNGKVLQGDNDDDFTQRLRDLQISREEFFRLCE